MGLLSVAFSLTHVTNNYFCVNHWMYLCVFHTGQLLASRMLPPKNGVWAEELTNPTMIF